MQKIVSRRLFCRNSYSHLLCDCGGDAAQVHLLATAAHPRLVVSRLLLHTSSSLFLSSLLAKGGEEQRSANLNSISTSSSARRVASVHPCHSTWTRRSTRRRRRESQKRGHHADCPGGTRFHRRPSVRSAVASRAPREHPPPPLARHFVRPRIPAGVSCRHRRQRSLPASASARVATVALPAPGSAPPCRSVARVWWSRPHALLLVTVPANSGTSCVRAAGLLGGSWFHSRRSPRRVVYAGSG